MKRAVAIGLVSVASVFVACGSSGDRGFDDQGGAPGAVAPGSSGDLGKAVDAGSDARPPAIGTLSGKVVMPEGTIPLSDALVYLTKAPPAAIPQGAYCDKCVELDSYAFTYSKPDGTFDLPAYEAGDQFLVVQKGQFRRVRPINVVPGAQGVAGDLTRLPGKTDVALGDTTPRMLIWPGQWDHVEKSLTKIGVTDYEKFDPGLNLGAYSDKIKALSSYQIVFLPCSGSVSEPGGSSGLACSVSVDPQLKAAAKSFVEAGGKLYVSDWSYEYVRQGWPGAVKWVGETNQLGSGCQPGGADSPAQFDDKSLNDWMTAIGEGNATLKSAWSTIEKVSSFASVDENGKSFMQTPKVWASVKGSGTHPATVSFQDRCGRVLYSTYHAEGSDSAFGQGDFLAQEKALMHILLEVGVCVGPKPVAPVR